MIAFIVISIFCNLCFEIAQQEIPKLDLSVKEINNRYSSNPRFTRLLDHFNSISEEDSNRNLFFENIKSQSKMSTVVLVFENSTSGEAYGYRGIAYGKDAKGKYYKLDYQYYSGTEKCKTYKIKHNKKLIDLLSELNTNEYDSLDKISFPSELIIISYRNDKGKWNYRISSRPSERLAFLISY